MGASSTQPAATADRKSRVLRALRREPVDRLPVQTNIPMHAGATYFVSVDGAEFAIAVSTVPASLASDAMRAAWMADKGCEAQAEALARTRR